VEWSGDGRRVCLCSAEQRERMEVSEWSGVVMAEGCTGCWPFYLSTGIENVWRRIDGGCVRPHFTQENKRRAMDKLAARKAAEAAAAHESAASAPEPGGAAEDEPLIDERPEQSQQPPPDTEPTQLVVE
jgi:hypothetical protein